MSYEYLTNEQLWRLSEAMSVLVEETARLLGNTRMLPGIPGSHSLSLRSKREELETYFNESRNNLIRISNLAILHNIQWNPFHILREFARQHKLNYTQLVFELHSHLPFWGGNNQSRSGHGSTEETTTAIVIGLKPLLLSLKVGSLLDAPCGDFAWARRIDWSGITYTGADIVSDIIEENQQKFGSYNIHFQRLNICCDPLPQAEAILCRDGLFHLSWEDALAALRNFKQSGAIYLLSTTFPQSPDNVNIQTGEWYPINLQRPPFNFPNSQEQFQDGYQNRYLGVWRLSDIP